MAAVEELIRREADGSISFGNHTLSEKAKVEDFSHEGDLYKVKTYRTMTKLGRRRKNVHQSGRKAEPERGACRSRRGEGGNQQIRKADREALQQEAAGGISEQEAPAG